MNAPPPEPLTDGTLVLRAPRIDDADAVTAACQDPRIARWTLAIPSPYERRHALAWLAACADDRRTGGPPAFVVDAGSGVDGAIGVVGAGAPEGVAEVGYWVAPWARRRGVGSGALRLLATWLCAERRVRRVQAMILVGNIASEGVAAAAGFRREGVLRGYHVKDGVPVDVSCWALLAADLEG